MLVTKRVLTLNSGDFFFFFLSQVIFCGLSITLHGVKQD